MDKSSKQIRLIILCILIFMSFMPSVPHANEGASERNRSDEANINAVFLFEHLNKKYVDKEKLDMKDMATPVSIARGVATYNYEKQKDYEFGRNSIASLYYEVPIYDLDKKGDYYVAMPNVNMGDPRIGSYDFEITYNNDFAEKVWGCIFEDNIAYIPKTALDKPGNKNKINSSDVKLAMQLNYYFKDFKEGEEADYSKEVPVQIITATGVEYKSAKTDNMFADESFSFKLGDYDKSKIHVMVNGTVLPINPNSYNLEDGMLTIYSSPAVISGITIVVDRTSAAESFLGFFTDRADAAVGVSPDEMRYYKTAGGKEVIITSNLSDIYVGWRGHYEAAKPIKYAAAHQSAASPEHKISVLKALPEWMNSLGYMYGAYTDVYNSSWNGAGFRGYWALSSYTKGVNVANGSTMSKTFEYENPFDPDTTDMKKTIYDWMRFWAARLERNNGSTELQSNGSGWMEFNGLGSVNNFAVPWPKSLIKGDERNLVSNENAEGYGPLNSGNPDIRFDTETESGKSVLAADDYFAAACAHISSSAAEDGTFDGETNRTVYVSCLAKGNDYVVLCFAIAGITEQEAMAVYKFRTGRPVQIKKKSMEPDVTAGNQNYSLSGAKYKLYESRSDAKENKDVVCSFTTEENGNSNTVTVAPGTYYLVETTPSPGHIIPDGYKASEGGKQITVTGGSDTLIISMEEPIIRGDLRLEKWDAELDSSEAMGGTDLEGIEFTIYNRTGGPVAVPSVMDPGSEGYKAVSWGTSGKGKEALTNGNAKLVKNGDAVGIITTKKNKDGIYEAMTSGLALPYGTYEIKETKTNKYYQLTDNTTRTVNITKHKVVVESTADGGPLVWKNNVWRQNFSFEKTGITEEGEKRLPFIPFKITNIETGEFHYVVTDQNGIFNSYTHPKTRDTNGFDDFIASSIEEDGIVDSEELKNMMLGDEIEDVAPGTWFGTGEQGTESGANDSLAGLPYGIYEVEELRCTNNKEFTLCGPFTIEVKRPTPASILNTEPDGGRGIVFEVENRVDAPVIGTTASCEETGSNLGIVGENVTIIDKIKYENLPAGEEYVITGTLMDKSTNRPLNQDGATVTMNVTPGEDNGFFEMKFEISSEKLMGKDLVVFEELRKAGDSTEDNPLAEHKNLGDEGQTIHFPGVGTKAEHAETKAGVGMASAETIIKDAVAYSNLIEGKTYTITGTLMDKETGEPVQNNGNDVISEPVTFTPEEPDGEIDVTFNLATDNMLGKSMVAFESLKEGDKELVSHSDINNEDQTVYIPKIATTAKDKNSGDNEADPSEASVIIDTVKYEGLRPNLEYEISGTLVRKSDGKPVISKCSEVVSKEKFTPSEAKGEVEMTFELDSRDLAGESVVVYEEIYHNGKLIASHADLNDEGQTINYKKKEKKSIKNNSKKTTKPKSSSRSAKTGDDFLPMAALAIMLFGLLIMLLAFFMDKKTGK